MPRDVPDRLDAVTGQRVVRTFLLVRIVRGSLILLFLAIALTGVEIRGWPTGVAVAIAIALLLQVVALGVWVRRYVSIGEGSRSERRRGG
jgi:hypothetical protein